MKDVLLNMLAAKQLPKQKHMQSTKANTIAQITKLLRPGFKKTLALVKSRV